MSSRSLSRLKMQIKFTPQIKPLHLDPHTKATKPMVYRSTVAPGSRSTTSCNPSSTVSTFQLASRSTNNSSRFLSILYLCSPRLRSSSILPLKYYHIFVITPLQILSHGGKQSVLKLQQAPDKSRSISRKFFLPLSIVTPHLGYCKRRLVSHVVRR